MKTTHQLFAILLAASVATASLSGCSSGKKYVVDGRNDQSESGETYDDAYALDPFDGLTVQFDGVSPLCTVSFNNSQCSEEVQQYVDYSLEPDEVTTEKYFKINEEVIVYALLKNSYGQSQEYRLTETQKSYTVQNVAEYITELSAEDDLRQFKQEAKDYMKSVTAFSVGDYLYDWDCVTYKSNTAPKKKDCYFSVLKLSSYDKYPNDVGYFNRIDITYSINMTDDGGNALKRYFTVIAKNIVKSADGQISWGKENPDDLNFELDISTSNMQSLINNNITSNKDNYNVTTVSELLK